MVGKAVSIRALVQSMPDGWQGCIDTRSVRDDVWVLLVLRNVEVNADEHALALHVHISNALLRQGGVSLLGWLLLLLGCWSWLLLLLGYWSWLLFLLGCWS